MKKIIHLCIFLLFVSSLAAQKQKVHVKLHNGAVFNGKLLESESDDEIRLLAKKNIWVIPKAKIDTLLKNKYRLYTEEITIPWFFKAEYGVLLGNSDAEEEAISFFHGIFNYQLHSHFYGGGGVGVEYYQQRTYIPAFVNLEYRFRATKFSPYVFLKAGYLLPAENKKHLSNYDNYESRNLHPKYLDASGGVMLSPGLGVSKMFGPNFGMSFSAAYRYNELNYSGKEEYELEQRYNRLSFTLGIIFK